MKKLILGIETSCDETSLALVEATSKDPKPHRRVKAEGQNPESHRRVEAENDLDPSTSSGLRFKVLENLVASQVKIHAPYGGVVPNLAKREHIKNLPILLKNLIAKRYTLNAVDIIAVTVGPGLEPALWTGINFAKELTNDLRQMTSDKKPILIGANHLEGHLYSFLLPSRSQKSSVISYGSKVIGQKSKVFPAIALIVSGGHTILLKMDSLIKWKKLGETRDDAVGEAFDKVARILNLPYPGGPEIEKLARDGDPHAIMFPRPMLHQKNYDFSFSGLKTAVFYYMRDLSANYESNTNIQIRKHTTSLNASARGGSTSGGKRQTLNANVAASFQQAAIEVLVTKTMRAVDEYNAKSVMLSGGVAANKALRATLRKEAKKRDIKFFVPDFIYNTDNAAMIAAAGYINFLRGKKYLLSARGDMSL